MVSAVSLGQKTMILLLHFKRVVSVEDDEHLYFLNTKDLELITFLLLQNDVNKGNYFYLPCVFSDQ